MFHANKIWCIQSFLYSPCSRKIYQTQRKDIWTIFIGRVIKQEKYLLKCVDSTINMFIVKIIVIALFYDTLCKSSGIIIGYIPGQVYVPSSSSGSPPISYYFENSCQECLCRAIMSTNSSFVAINCLTISHLCMFYTNYATNFTIKSNSTAYLYLFQSLPQLGYDDYEDDNARNINNGSDE